MRLRSGVSLEPSRFTSEFPIELGDEGVRKLLTFPIRYKRCREETFTDIEMSAGEGNKEEGEKDRTKRRRIDEHEKREIVFPLCIIEKHRECEWYCVLKRDNVHGDVELVELKNVPKITCIPGIENMLFGMTAQHADVKSHRDYKYSKMDVEYYLERQKRLDVERSRYMTSCEEFKRVYRESFISEGFEKDQDIVIRPEGGFLLRTEHQSGGTGWVVYGHDNKHKKRIPTAAFSDYRKLKRDFLIVDTDTQSLQCRLSPVLFEYLVTFIPNVLIKLVLEYFCFDTRHFVDIFCRSFVS
jgi:hypothetical protein